MKKVRSIRIITILFIGLLIPNCHARDDRFSNLQKKAEKAFEYSKKNKLDTGICILIDMDIHSGKNRLFLWDFKKDSILKEGLCSHGSCGGKTGPETSTRKAVFSNVHQSYCSSLGKYKIGKRGYSNYGIHINYKLHGLESSNNNAYDRIIVLHSYGGVPDDEIYPGHVMNSLGCPMVSNKMMKYLDKKLKKAEGNVMMWIYK